MDLNSLEPEQIKQLIGILQTLIPSSDKEVNTTSKKEPKKKAVKPKVKKNTNKFDNMPEMHLHKEDIEIDRKLNRFSPTPRRGEFKPLKVVCRVCGKSEMVDPSIIESPDRYKCNKCAIAAG
jgi:hypothetical protein